MARPVTDYTAIYQCDNCQLDIVYRHGVWVDKTDGDGCEGGIHVPDTRRGPEHYVLYRVEVDIIQAANQPPPSKWDWNGLIGEELVDLHVEVIERRPCGELTVEEAKTRFAQETF